MVVYMVTNRMKSSPRYLLHALLTSVCVLSITGEVAAALGPAESRCQKGAARAAEKFMRRSVAAIAACHDGVSRGVLGAGTDCRSEPATSRRLADAAAGLTGRVSSRCTDAAVSALDFGASCRGSLAAADLAACLGATHDAEIDAAIGTLYATTGQISEAERRCQARAASQLRRFAAGRMRLLQRCKNRAARERLPAGTVCAAEPEIVAKIERRRQAAVRQIERRCDAAVLTVLDFGGPCAGPPGPGELSRCLLAMGDSRGDVMLAVEYGDTVKFCGDSTQAVEARIESTLAQMTLAEKVDQMHGVPGGAPIAGLFHTPDNDRLGIPGFRMVDGPRGVRTGNATAFPVGMARGATWDPALEERVGDAIGTEARAKGASVILAPVINLLRHPRWGRAQETYGEDPYHLGEMGSAFVRGAQRHVVASAKHFALNSIEDTRFDVNVTAAERTLREIYLPHFRKVVRDAGVASVMSAYNKVNGSYCGENFDLLRDVLKGEWGFQGFVESDWILGTRSTVPSALAGLDVEMPFPIYYGDLLVTAVERGDVPEATIDGAVRGILRAKFCFRLDTNPPEVDPALVETTAHTELAREVEEEAIVLLKNQAACLPLDRSSLRSLAVVGELAGAVNLGDTGSSNVTPSYAITALAGITAAAGGVAVTYVASNFVTPAAEVAIAAADAAVVVVGLTAADEGESLVGAGDRTMLPLASDLEQMILDVAALNDRTIVVLEGGSAIVVEGWIDQVEGLLMAWYPGLEGGNAIAGVLFGDVNPSGHLPISFPRSESDLPPFVNDRNEVTYGYYHGYRHLDRTGVSPRFEFGFGLSYTTFAYSNLMIADTTLDPDGTLEATVDVTNTGTRAGDDVVQLYVGYVGSAVDRPGRDLKDFARVLLAPGETKVVSLSVPVESFATYDETSGSWRVEAISYVAEVGSSSRNLPLSASFQVGAGT